MCGRKKIFVYSFLLLPFVVKAQLVTNNGLSATVQSGLTVTVEGGYTSKDDGATNGKIDNQGIIQLTGDWTNNNSLATPNVFSTSAGTVIFNGSALQTIGGTNTTTFYNTTIANTGAGLTFSAVAYDITSTNGLTFTSGVVTTGTNKFILSNPVFSSLTYTNGFVNGNFRRYITAPADVNTYLLPIGNGTAATDRHRLSFLNNSIAGVTYLDASVRDFTQAAANVDANLNTTQGGTPILSTEGEAAGETVIWTLTPDAAPSGGTYGVQLYVENTNLTAADDNMFCPLKRTIPSATYADFLTYESLPTTIPAAGAAGRIYSAGAGYAQRNGYTSFSEHAIGIGMYPLPVELLAFDAQPEGKNVKVTWTTASEFNSDHFIVQRSQDGINFENVTSVKAFGNSTTVKKYAAVDYEPYDGVSYYRLKQVDNDGSFAFSNIVAVKFSSTPSLSVYPNPADDIFHATYSGKKGERVRIVVRDVLGKEHFSEVFILMSDSETVALDPSGKLAAGVYLVTASSDGSIYEKKLVIR